MFHPIFIAGFIIWAVGFVLSLTRGKGKSFPVILMAVGCGMEIAGTIAQLV